MQRFFCLFAALALALALSCQAMAAVQTFHSQIKDFTVDVPEGWQAKAIPDGCQIGSADGRNGMSIQMVPADGRAPKDVAMAAAKAANAVVKEEEVDGESATLACELNGSPLLICVVNMEGCLFSVVMAGEDEKTMEKIFDSLEAVDDGEGGQKAGGSPFDVAIGHVAGDQDKAVAGNVQEFGVPGHRFTVAVPEGWQVKTDKNTVFFHNPQGALRFFATSDENPGMSAGDMAEGLAKSADISGTSTVEKSSSRARVRGRHKDGMDASILVLLDGKHVLIVTIVEPEDEATKAAVASLAFVK